MDASIWGCDFKLPDDEYAYATRPGQEVVGPDSEWEWSPRDSKEITSFIRMCRKQQYKSFIDIGAHWGLFSYIYCSQTSTHSCVSIEPIRSQVERMQKIAEYNAFNMKPLHLGLGNKTDIFHYVDAGCARWVSGQEAGADSCNIITLDELTATYNLQPELIKLDTEGMENFVMEGGKNTFATYKPDMMLEAHGPESTNMGTRVEKIVEYLDPTVYSFYSSDLKRAIAYDDLAQYVQQTETLYQRTPEGVIPRGVYPNVHVICLNKSRWGA